MSSGLAMETRKVYGDRWKHYPAYKDSGVEWVGEVPEHWGLKRLKYISTVNDGTLSETTDSDFELLYVDISSVDPVLGIKNKELMTFENAPSRARRKVCHGDVILSTVRTYLRAISPINDPEPNMIVSTGFAVIRPKDGLESQFAAYALRAPYFVDEVVANSVGVSYPAINANELITFNVALPPLPEQHAIATFLDRETGHIDALIVNKERQTELLREKRAALISHAVTKGLDPDAPMKDSGVEWLGEVPEHWNILALRRVVSRFVDYRGKTPEKVDRGVPLITAKNIKDGHIDLSQSQEFMREDEYQDWMTRGWPEIGDVLITTEAPLGEVAQVEDTFIALAQRIILLKVNKSRIINDYLKYHFLSTYGQGELWTRASGSTALGIKAERFKGTLVSVPPLNEQQKITRYLDSEISRLERPSSKIRESISKLREYRTALISAAVTGKIDVREELVS